MHLIFTDFYALVNDYWNLNANQLQNITILSVAGGFRDYQVRPGLTFLPSLKFKNSALSVVVIQFSMSYWNLPVFFFFFLFSKQCLQNVKGFLTLIPYSKRHYTLFCSVVGV